MNKQDAKGFAMIGEIESEWRDTGIECPFCKDGWTVYTDGKNRPVCPNEKCLRAIPYEYIWDFLITRTSTSV